MRLCAHFGVCGGCDSQNLEPSVYAEAKLRAVAGALARAGVKAEVAPVISVSPGTRRRAVLKVFKRGGHVEIGFRAAKSHSIIDMQECLVLKPSLFAAISKFREIFSEIFSDGSHADLHLTDTETGLDVSIKASVKAIPKFTSVVARAAPSVSIARVTWNGEPIYSSTAPTVRFGAAAVKIPPESFLQASDEGERLLQSVVTGYLGKSKFVADLFAGCGTFSLPLAAIARVHAVDQDGRALASLEEAARATNGLKPISTEKRNLFKQPLTPAELKPYDGVLLDPPRAGAAAQCAQLAKSGIRRIAYVSCNAESFAADAAKLAGSGYFLEPVRPIDQFLWSSHIELAALFRKP